MTRSQFQTDVDGLDEDLAKPRRRLHVRGRRHIAARDPTARPMRVAVAQDDRPDEQDR